MSLIIISFDAVSSQDISVLQKMPNFSNFLQSSALALDVSSTFITNTYPVHTSVITGCNPSRHGVCDNALEQPRRVTPDWRFYRKFIKVPTLYDMAAKNGLTCASVMWPVTGRAKIKYNVPEIFATKPHQNQVMLSLLAGSKKLQFDLARKYGHILKGVSQPELDRFSTAVMCEIIKTKKPDLMLIHLTDVDAAKHRYGPDSKEAAEALIRLDKRLGNIFSALTAANMANTSVIVFGDHSCKLCHTTVNPYDILEQNGIVSPKTSKNWQAFAKPSGGCTLLKVRDKSVLEKAVSAFETAGCIKRKLSTQEMAVSGFADYYDYGFEGANGVRFSITDDGDTHVGDHGYSLEQENYTVFYAVKGDGIQNGTYIGGSLLDIAPIAAKLLNISQWDIDGKLRIELFGGE